MARDKTYYVCKECRFETPNWMGRCTNCGAWNSFVEVDSGDSDKNPVQSKEVQVSPSPITRVKQGMQTRFPSGIKELDRVLGGGVVAGSLILLGGAPGIGKSTLVLQVAFLFCNKYGKVLYVSGEESPGQLKLRAKRLGTLADNLLVLGETEFDQISKLINREDDYNLIVIDSIQTVYDSRLDSAPGSISQVKEITNQLIKLAKQKEIPIILIGHVTKQGNLAGPKVLEHLVDTVLQFEGDQNYVYRILRAAKNRFGSTNEIGVFEMKESGMKEIPNPSQLFLAERPRDVAGSVIVPVIEGSRTILVEVQALISSAAFSTPQRLTTAMNNKKISMLLAVLEKKAGFNFQSQDVHLNITGGLKVNEPALDLGMITAIISSYQDYSLSPDLAVVGEVGLAGEIRAVGQIKKRFKELKKTGFKEVIIPAGNLKSLDFDPEINLKGVKDIHEVMNTIFI